MNEYLATLDPVSLVYCLIIAIGTLIGTMICAYYQAKSSFDCGVSLGRSMHKQDVFNAENRGYKAGHDAASHEANPPFPLSKKPTKGAKAK